MSEKPIEDSAIHYAYSCIHNFFDAFALEPALQYIDSILKAAIGTKVWKKEAPSNLIFYIEKLKTLCGAVFTIHYNYAERKEAIIIESENGIPDITVTKNFLNKYYFSNAWNNFPRHLSARQYHNPYTAIKKFCNYIAEQEWNNFLKEIIGYALSKSQLDEIGPSYNILVIRMHLMQLIEACHLLDVRTNGEKIENTSDQKEKEL